MSRKSFINKAVEDGAASSGHDLPRAEHFEDQ